VFQSVLINKKNKTNETTIADKRAIVRLLAGGRKINQEKSGTENPVIRPIQAL
jgi:hypothetical protein